MMGNVSYDGCFFIPLRMSSKPIESSQPLRVSRARFELGRKGKRWILKKASERLKTMVIMIIGRLWYNIHVSKCQNTCLAALYSICSLRGAWRPWMFLSVLKFILSWLSWNWFHITQAGVTLCNKDIFEQCNDTNEYRGKVNNIYYRFRCL